MSAQLLVEKIYSSESLIDVERDITDAIDDANIPVDEYGFHEGRFIVTVKWEPDA